MRTDTYLWVELAGTKLAHNNNLVADSSGYSVTVPTTSAPSVIADRKPAHSGWVLVALVTGAVVANINLAIANVALPDIGKELGASQDQLTLVAAAFATALAATVLYLGAIGDRYGRKKLFVIGAIMTIPTSMLAAWAPTVEVLILARLLSGVAAALLFPTTLSLIGALYSGKPALRAVALWSGIGAGTAALGPILGGWLLESFWWGSVFLIAVPLVIVPLVVGIAVLPHHSGEEVFKVDHLGGITSVIGIGALVIAINTIAQGWSVELLVELFIAIVALVIFFIVQTKAQRPLIDLVLARARTMWVAFAAGAIAFGSLIGAMFIGQQFTQNVLGYDTLTAAAVVLPSAIMIMVGGQIAGKVIDAFGSRVCLTIGLGFVALAFAGMLFLWNESANIYEILGVYALVGTGVGLSATPTSRSLMNSVPIRRAGMGSAFLDLTRDFGGAIMQALMGGLLAAFYVRSLVKTFDALPASEATEVSRSLAAQITSSYTSAAEAASGYPANQANAIIAAAQQAFTDGKSAAIAVALLLTLAALILVIAIYPRKHRENEYYADIANT